MTAVEAGSVVVELTTNGERHPDGDALYRDPGDPGPAYPAARPLGELEALREEADESRAEVTRLTNEVESLRIERDAARLEAAAHAETSRVVADSMGRIVEELRDKLEGIRHDRLEVGRATEASRESERQCHELRGRLSEIEGSRAWSAVTFYRGVRTRLSPRP